MESQSHYFSESPEAPSEPTEISVEARGIRLLLRSDRAVFSRARIDSGTLLLARAMELPERGRILDLGCGYGVLGILAAMLCPQASVVLVDINRRAADLARSNCERHKLANAEVLTGDARVALGDRVFDAVVCNPPYRAGKATTMSLLQDAARRLEAGGRLWVVGRTKQGIKTLARDLQSELDRIETVARKGGYRVIVGEKHDAHPPS